MPPASFARSAANLAPICAELPSEEAKPVSGTLRPTLISAMAAVQTRALDKASARGSFRSERGRFMGCLLRLNRSRPYRTKTDDLRKVRGKPHKRCRGARVVRKPHF